MPEGQMVRKSQKDLYLKLYRTLYRIRRSQEVLMAEYHPAEEMRCPIHFCLGQEGAPAALSAILRPADVVMSHHRSHGYYLAKGSPLAEMVAEFYGKRTGANGGLAGSQELSHEATKFYSGTILSGMFAMANGAAFSQKYTKSDNITVTVIGDGGMEEGIVYEALNLAALKHLPVLFICENNLYSAHTRIDLRSLSHTLTSRVAPFGVPTEVIDGNDPVLAYRSLSAIVDRMRMVGGPAFVEVMTYRTCGHVGPENDDVIGYRTAEELAKWRQRDPLAVMREALAISGVGRDDVGIIDRQIDAEIADAVSAAKKAAFPKYEDALELNLSNSYDPVIKQFGASGISTFEGGQKETKLAPY